MDVKAINTIALTRSPAASARGAATESTQSAAGVVSDSGNASAATKAAQAGFVYISPIVRYDQAARLAVLFYRDAETGETRDQIPAERVVEEYRRSAARLAGDGGDASPPAGDSGTGSGVAATDRLPQGKDDSSLGAKAGSAYRASPVPAGSPAAGGGETGSVAASAGGTVPGTTRGGSAVGVMASGASSGSGASGSGGSTVSFTV